MAALADVAVGRPAVALDDRTPGLYHLFLVHPLQSVEPGQYRLCLVPELSISCRRRIILARDFSTLSFLLARF